MKGRWTYLSSFPYPVSVSQRLYFAYSKCCGMVNVLLALFLLMLSFLGMGCNQRKTIELNNYKADKLLEIADSLVLEWELDSCLKYIDESEKLYSGEFKSKAVLYKKEIGMMQSDGFMRKAFETIDEESYKLLEDGKYKMEYFQTPSIKKAIEKKLYENMDLLAGMIAEKKEREKLARKEEERKRKEEEKAKKEAEKIARKLFEKILRNNFLDAGFDIQVAVKGSNYDRLELTFVLFNDVWLRKMETEGLIATWHEIGFNRIDVKDGYDYHKYFHW